MNKTIFTFFIFLCCSIFCNAQITWEKLFVQSSTDVFRSVQEVPSGGYILAGYTADWSSSDTDAYVVRMTPSGDTLWTRRFNGGKKDLFYKVINTSDGGFALCGYKTTAATFNDAFYMKLDANGSVVWQNSYGGTGNERGQEIIQTADGGYAICGYTTTATGAQGFNSFLLKLDANGGQTWSKKYGGNGYDDSNSLKQLPDGGYILAGQSVPPPGILSGEIYLIRTNTSGDTVWTRTFNSGMSTGSNENAEYIQLTSGGFIITGSVDSLNNGNSDGYLVKTDTSGNVIWDKNFGGSLPDDFHRVENTSDGGFILIGTSQSNALNISNEWLFKTDASGDSSWAYTFGGDNHDHGYSGMQTSDGGYILCGYSASFGFNYEDAHVIKVNGSGLLYNHLVYTTVTALVSPVSGICGSANTTVTITVRNFGDTAISIFPDTVVVSNAINQTLGQTFNTLLVPMDLTNHTFSTAINTSGGGTFHFHCFTSNNNDVYPAMNSLDTDITINAQPSAPTVTNDTICGPGDVTLSASSSGTLEWYANSSGGSVINTGPSYTVTISSTTTYYVQAVTPCGTSPRVAVTGYVSSPTTPPIVFDGARCGPGEVTLLANAASQLSWWDASTGGNMVAGDITSFIATVTITTTFYVQAGTGTACPSVRVPVTATVNPLPDAAFTPSAPAVCLGDAFLFTNNTTGAVNYYWDFGDATGTSTLSDPTYTYTQTGNYDVSLIAETSLNCFDTITINVGVTTAPQVSFTTATTDVCVPYDVVFTNLTSNATSFSWTFGDGGTSSDQYPIHTYTTEGVYTVTLLATVGSCADSDSVVDMITTHMSPVVDLGPDVTTNSVVYDLDAGSGFSSYLWDNGETTQTITAGTNGVYCVIVTGSNSCSDTDCVNVTLDAAGIADIGSSEEWSIYPNPAHDHFILSLSKNDGWYGSPVNVYDTFGKKIFESVISTTEMEVQVDGWDPGMYVIEITSGKNMLRQKLVIY